MTLPKSLHQSETFCVSLTCAFRPDYPIVQRAKQIPWKIFKDRFDELHCPDSGRLGLFSQMMTGLLPKHARGFSDEKVVEWWLESPHAQYFYEERQFQQESQMDSSRLSRFRTRIEDLLPFCKFFLRGLCPARCPCTLTGLGWLLWVELGSVCQHCTGDSQ